MADYDFRFELQSPPTAHNDGSGCVAWPIVTYYRDQAAAPVDPWTVFPSRSKTFNIPYDELKAVNDMPDGTTAQKQTKNDAYKDLLETNLNTQNVPITGWSVAQMELALDNNDAATIEAARVDDYIINTLGQSYPVPFKR